MAIQFGRKCSGFSTAERQYDDVDGMQNFRWNYGMHYCQSCSFSMWKDSLRLSFTFACVLVDILLQFWWFAIKNR